MAMKVPGVINLIHFTDVWNNNWSLLFDNFIDGLHAPYLHRLSPQFLLRRLQYRALDGRPHFQFVEHDGKLLEAIPRCAPRTPTGLVFQMEFPGLGKFPVNNWWRVRAPKMKPKNNFMPGIAPGSFLHGLPSYVHTVHKDALLYAIHYPDGPLPPVQHVRHHRDILKESRKLWWNLYFKIFSVTHDEAVSSAKITRVSALFDIWPGTALTA